MMRSPDEKRAIDADLLDEIEEFLDDRADAQVIGDPPEYQGNAAMSLLCRLREEMGK